jgi:2,5-diketo-D-gluconate reductase A
VPAAVGVSNYDGDRLQRILDRFERPPAVNQVHFSPFHYRRRLLELCERSGVVLEAYSPLERGKALGDPVVAEIARRLGRTSAQVLLRWGIERGAVVIPKSVRRERIQENAQIFDFSLPPDDLHALDALDTTAGARSAR